MKRSNTVRPLRSVLAAVMSAAIAGSGATAGLAAPANDAPFGDAVELADNALDTVRGGFAGDDGGMLRFGVDLTRTVNGVAVATMAINNFDHGKLTATLDKFGQTILVPSIPTVSVTSPTASVATSTVSVAPLAVSTASTGVSTILPNGPPTGPGAPGSNTSTTLPALASSDHGGPEAGSAALDTAVATGQLRVTSGLLANGNGVLTIIQNNQSQVLIDTVQTLNIRVSGINTDLLRSVAAVRALSNALSLSTRR